MPRPRAEPATLARGSDARAPSLAPREHVHLSAARSTPGILFGLLAAAGQALPEDSYLPTDMLDPVDIASRLMQVYKDESLRNQLIRQAAGVVFPDMAAAAEALWDSLGPAQE